MNFRCTTAVAVLVLVALAGGFWLGGWWQQLEYNHACLDGGGGMEPRGCPLRVTEKTASCSNVIGSWVEPVPGRPELVQGIVLYADGSARSINMATLLYQSWRISGDNLVLRVRSIGNHTSSEDDETYLFSLPDKDTLLLRSGELVITYRRMGIARQRRLSPAPGS